jgi:4-hydroxy-tetrahydrodipicolinate reductase
MPDLRLIVAGAGGRMGRTLVKAIGDTPGLMLAGAVEGDDSSLLGQDSGVLAGLPPNRVPVTSEVKPLALAADAILDFTIPAATVKLAALAAETHLAHIIGTTGMSAKDDAAVAEAAKKTVIVKSGNMSLGVNLLAVLTKKVAQALGEEFDIEIVEMHHNKKIDAPSGTALLFGQAAAAGRGVDLATHSERGRDGHTGARKVGHIGFASLRGGNVAGDHSVIFAGADERIELTHKATDRMIFARGALTAAKWTQGKPPGLYSMLDVLGLKDG